MIISNSVSSDLCRPSRPHRSDWHLVHLFHCRWRCAPADASLGGQGEDSMGCSWCFAPVDVPPGTWESWVFSQFYPRRTVQHHILCWYVGCLTNKLSIVSIQDVARKRCHWRFQKRFCGCGHVRWVAVRKWVTHGYPQKKTCDNGEHHDKPLGIWWYFLGVAYFQRNSDWWFGTFFFHKFPLYGIILPIDFHIFLDD